MTRGGPSWHLEILRIFKDFKTAEFECVVPKRTKQGNRSLLPYCQPNATWKLQRLFLLIFGVKNIY